MSPMAVTQLRLSRRRRAVPKAEAPRPSIPASGCGRLHRRGPGGCCRHAKAWPRRPLQARCTGHGYLAGNLNSLSLSSAAAALVRVGRFRVTQRVSLAGDSEIGDWRVRTRSQVGEWPVTAWLQDTRSLTRSCLSCLRRGPQPPGRRAAAGPAGVPESRTPGPPRARGSRYKGTEPRDCVLHPPCRGAVADAVTRRRTGAGRPGAPAAGGTGSLVS